MVALGRQFETYLSTQLFVDGWVLAGAEGLLEKRQQHRDDDGRFEAFSEADEEDYFLQMSAALHETGRAEVG